MPIYLQFLLSISIREYSGQLIITDTKTKVILFLAQGRLAWAIVVNEDLMFDKQLPFLTGLKNHLDRVVKKIIEFTEPHFIFYSNQLYNTYELQKTFLVTDILGQFLHYDLTMTLDVVLSKQMQNISECVAAGYVDMTTGMLLAVKTIDKHPQEVLDVVAAATADLFQGPSVTSIEKMFRKTRGQQENGSHYFKEIVVFSENLLHVFLRGKKRPDNALVFVCRGTANIGMVLSKSRLAVVEVESII